MRYRFTIAELSGALADLGVLLPLMLALIALNGISTTSAFVGVGLAYLITSVVYRLPIPVQPLKSLAATALALGLSAQVIVAGAWWMAFILLILALTNAVHWIGKLFPKPVVRGIQLGLGLLLVRSAWRLVTDAGSITGIDLTLGLLALPWTWAVAIGGVLVLGIMLLLRREWAALGVVLFGVVYSVARNGFPALSLAFSPPPFLATMPASADIGSAFLLLAIPQVPLSLANAVFATRDTAQQYFGDRADHVTPRRLLATMGISNIGIALVGGMPICHGSGGLTAHYRLGARSGAAPLILGFGFLSLGLLGGQTLLPVLGLIPFPALGVLLAFVGVQHALLAKDLRGWREWVPAISTAAVALYTRNLALGFGVGIVMNLVLEAMQAWVRLPQALQAKPHTAGD